MLAFAWKSLGWFLGGVAVTLGFLAVPLQVAAERKKLDRTVAEIVQARRDIRSLETEFETRANIAQLEKWNGETLRLSAPVAGQYIANEAALAQVDFNATVPGAANLQMASLIVPSQGGNAAAAAQVVGPVPAAQSVLPARSIPGVATAAVAAPAALHRVPVAGAAAGAADVIVAQVRRAAISRPKAQAVAMLDRQLLSDTTIGDLLSAAKAEAKGLR